MRDIYQKLVNKYPELFTTGDEHPAKPLRFSFECNDGWYKLLEKMCKRLNEVLRTQPEYVQNTFFITQIKEKFGTLRVYTTWATNVLTAIMEEAESESLHTCEECGNEGKLRNDLGWVRCLCETHYKKTIDKLGKE
jgi:hypothetical protein